MASNLSVLNTNVLEEEVFNHIITNCTDDIRKILDAVKITGKEHDHFPFQLNYVQLCGECPATMKQLTWHPDKILSVCDEAMQRAVLILSNDYEKSLIVGKRNVHVRIHSMPAIFHDRYFTMFPGCDKVGTFMTVIGTITRISSAVTSETMKEYICPKCKHIELIESSRNRYDSFPKRLDYCTKNCGSEKMDMKIESLPTTNAYTFRDYQEIKIQENTVDLGSQPKTLSVILEDDLVNGCNPGDDVEITGTLFTRCKPFRPNTLIDCELAILANHVKIMNDRRMTITCSEKTVDSFNEFWKTYQNDTFKGRNIILKSFCPEVFGTYLVKLALTVVLAGGVSKHEDNLHIRGESHILLVGDPGVAKSQFLKYACKIIPRSVFTTGIGTTTAGLTVTTVKEGDKCHMEPGSLILADGGICCIDEFTTLQEHDRTSIHEAMEQQTISIAKAGMRSTLKTKCSIIAACNPKLQNQTEDVDINVGLSSSLLSRFDLILVLKDTANAEYDEMITDFILGEYSINGRSEQNKPAWDIKKLRNYMIYIKRFNPIMSEDAETILRTYYHMQRQSLKRNVSRTTVRLYESLFRLTEGHARLMARNNIQVQDAIVAVTLIEASMQSSSILTPIPNVLHVVFPNDPFAEYYNQAQKILSILNLDDIWIKEMAHLNQLREKNINL